MTRRFAALCMLYFLAFSAVTTASAGAETLEEYQERMRREQEEAEKNKQEDDGSEDEACNIFGACCQMGAQSGCFDSLLSAFFSIFSDVRYADYPFAPNQGFDFSTFDPVAVTEETGEAQADSPRKFWMGELSVNGSYLFGQNIAMFGAQAILEAELLVFHINLFTQYLIDAQGTSLPSFSSNGGFSLPIGNFIVSLYAGVFWQDGFPVSLSWGASAKFFFRPGIIFSVYSLFSVYDPFFFIIVVPSLEVALDRFTIGVGFNFFDYNHLVLYGPTLKTAVWF